MPPGVGQRLLDDAIGGEADTGWQRALIGWHRQVDRRTRAPGSVDQARHVFEPGLRRAFGRRDGAIPALVAVISIVRGLAAQDAEQAAHVREIMGLDAPSRGSALVDGVPYRALRWPLRSVGAVLEARSFHPGRSAYGHLAALAAGGGIPVRRVREVLDQVGLGDVAARRAGTFSLGMAQRLSIAAALLGDPGVLLLDEPVNGLDPAGVRWIRDLIRSLAAQGRTVLVSSHLISEMALTADRLIVISRGRLVADTTAGELAGRAGGSLEDAFLGLTEGLGS